MRRGPRGLRRQTLNLSPAPRPEVNAPVPRRRPYLPGPPLSPAPTTMSSCPLGPVPSRRRRRHGARTRLAAQQTVEQDLDGQFTEFPLPDASHDASHITLSITLRPNRTP